MIKVFADTVCCWVLTSWSCVRKADCVSTTLFTDIFPTDPNADVTEVSVPLQTWASWAVWLSTDHLCSDSKPSSSKSLRSQRFFLQAWSDYYRWIVSCCSAVHKQLCLLFSCSSVPVVFPLISLDIQQNNRYKNPKANHTCSHGTGFMQRVQNIKPGVHPAIILPQNHLHLKQPHYYHHPPLW